MARRLLPITVVVSVAAADGSIERCLTAIRENGPAEVLVVDAGASARTLEVASHYTDHVIDATGPGADAYEAGARAASQPWIAFVEPEVVLAPDALHRPSTLNLGDCRDAGDTALLVERERFLDQDPRTRLPMRLDGNLDHGEDGYGLWLGASITEDAVYSKHWAGHGQFTVAVEPDQIVIRRAAPLTEGEAIALRRRPTRWLRALAVAASALAALGVAAAASAAYDGKAAATALVVAGIAMVVMLEVARGIDRPRIRAGVARFAVPVTSFALVALALSAVRLASVIGI